MLFHGLLKPTAYSSCLKGWYGLWWWWCESMLCYVVNHIIHQQPSLSDNCVFMLTTGSNMALKLFFIFIDLTCFRWFPSLVCFLWIFWLGTWTCFSCCVGGLVVNTFTTRQDGCIPSTGNILWNFVVSLSAQHMGVGGKCDCSIVPQSVGVQPQQKASCFHTQFILDSKSQWHPPTVLAKRATYITTGMGYELSGKLQRLFQSWLQQRTSLDWRTALLGRLSSGPHGWDCSSKQYVTRPSHITTQATALSWKGLKAARALFFPALHAALHWFKG